MQGEWGLSQDGVVGYDTWIGFRSEVVWEYTSGDYKHYKAPWETDVFQYNTVQKKWYMDRQCATNQRVGFWRYGPDYSACNQGSEVIEDA